MKYAPSRTCSITIMSSAPSIIIFKLGEYTRALLWIKLYKNQIRIVICTLICTDLRDRIVDGGLVRLAYGMD
jgi:hypothetical protein